jgi:hypothetical protein
MTQCTSSTLNQTSVADPSILRYTNFPLLAIAIRTRAALLG